MKKLFYVFVLIALASCAGKEEWSKDYLVKDCVKEMGKNKDTKVLSEQQRDQVCDCSADKLLAKYKSAKEVRADDAGAEAIGTECAMQVLMPDNTNPPDTTNQ